MLISIAFVFIVLDTLLWLAFGLINALNLIPAIPQGVSIRSIISALAFLTSAVMLGLGFLLQRRHRLAFLSVISLLMMISILTVTDEFGITDLAILILHLAPLALLVYSRRWFLQKYTCFRFLEIGITKCFA